MVGLSLPQNSEESKRIIIVLSSIKLYGKKLFLTHSDCHRLCWCSFNVSRVKKERHEDITFLYKKKYYAAMHVRQEITPTTVFNKRCFI